MAKSREVVQLHIGQAGIQIANACWELYCMEHGIRCDGTFCYDEADNNGTNAFFACNRDGRCIPRVVMIDLEPSVIDEIRTGNYRCLYSPTSLVSGREDAASNFARGYSIGNELIEFIMEKIRKVMERCCHTQGFLTFRSVGGGTGSGLGTIVLENLCECYPKIGRLEFDIFPSPRISPIIVEPYNAVLASHCGMDYSDCTFLLDNEAIYDICGRHLNQLKPTYTNLNRVIGQVVSCATASLRFDGPLNVDLLEFQTNLVPYPRIHFPIVTYAPLMAYTVGCSGYDGATTEQITNECFEPRNHMVKCNTRMGKYMSCCMLYRGDINASDVSQTLDKLKNESGIEFVDWVPTGFKIGVNYQPPTCITAGDLALTDKAVCMLSNSTAIRFVWKKLAQKFGDLFARKAFVHHYVNEGFEEGELLDAKENMETLIQDYEEIENEMEKRKN